MGWTTADLLTRIKLYAFFPSAQGGPPLSDSEILQLADDDLQTYVFPRVVAAQGEWRVHSERSPLVAGQAAHRIPARAHADRIRDALIERPGTGELVSLRLLQPSEIGERFGAHERASQPFGFWVQDGKVVLWPTPTTGAGALHLKYWMRPGRLVLPTECQRLANTGSTSGDNRVFSVSGEAAAWTTDTRLDIVRGYGGFSTTHTDLTIAATGTGSIEVPLAELELAELGVGDYLCVAGDSPIPQIPAALHTWLAQRAAAQVLNVLDEAQAFGRAQAKADETEARVIELIEPRVSGEPAVVVPFHSPLWAIRS